MSICLVVVMFVATRMALAAFGIFFRSAMTMRAIDDMRWDETVDKSRCDLDDNDSGQEETDKNICRGGGGEASARKVLFRGGEHAIQRGKELPVVRPNEVILS